MIDNDEKASDDPQAINIADPLFSHFLNSRSSQQK